MALIALWSDDPAEVDLLSFNAVAQTVVEALLDEDLDPVALGLSGSWGSGKTTVLGLIADELAKQNTSAAKILVVKTDPWRYDPGVGAKETLIEQVLAVLRNEIDQTEGAGAKAKELLAKLAKRINWSKALKLAATTGLALQIPKVDDLLDLVQPKEGSGEEDIKGLQAFQAEFRSLMAMDELAHVRAVVVLVDDLDRCLPETVIESLEAMKLFLSVKKMSFVIAADEQRVAEAIGSRFKAGVPAENGEAPEDAATLYLHKIVQTTIPLPTLSYFDTASYLVLLQAKANATPEQFAELIAASAAVRRAGGNMDDLQAPSGLSLVVEMAFASRMTPLLYEKLRGNPRRIKRFINDTFVRQSVASRRGIKLDPAMVAKLMILEILMKDDFKTLLEWFSKGEMRDRINQLEPAVADATAKDGDDGDTQPGDDIVPDPASDGAFSETMLRWAKLPPSLRDVDIDPYLTLAASFAGFTLVDSALPERLRDIAANLSSESRADQSAVKSGDLQALSNADGSTLLQYLGRTLRDRPSSQKAVVTAILRIARAKVDLQDAAHKALAMIPPKELTIATPILFTANDSATVRLALAAWDDALPQGAAVKNAIAAVPPAAGGSGGN
jgi:hypothetical protein